MHKLTMRIDFSNFSYASLLKTCSSIGLDTVGKLNMSVDTVVMTRLDCEVVGDTSARLFENTVLTFAPPSLNQRLGTNILENRI